MNTQETTQFFVNGDPVPSKEDFINACNVMQEEQVKQIEALEKELNVSYSCATAVQYLRTRSRHTAELEAELIRLHKAGTPPNIMEFGCNPAAFQQRLVNIYPNLKE